MPSYKISKEALKDIEHIWLYTFENWSVEQADRYYRLIMDEIEYLSLNFSAGRDSGYIKEGYRSSKVKSHLIFYKKSKDGIVEVVRILHESMDVENRLTDY
ncbi:type II toxin-antitoxin system RelE/ParE family toxin [Dysgonomonas sp. OttesenSCG-928-D17]|nr:type II toxin-antitoxin system RelE/ParE family toxin [Dysgonomonas sp. OttesenSCG-928-D17]